MDQATVSALREAMRGFQVETSRWQQPSDLSDVAIDVYVLTLLGECLTKDLDRRFGRANVEIARHELGAWQLIIDYRTSSGRTLAALPPVPAWTARAADFTWTVQATPDLLHDLEDTGNPIVDIARDVCREIARLASELWAVDVGPSLHHRTSLSNGARVSAALSLLFDQARHEVLAMSRGPRLPQLALLWEAIERRLFEDEFSYRRLVTIDELIEHGLAIVRRDVLKAGVDLYVGDDQSVNATYYVFDRDVAVRHDANGGEIVTHRREVNGLRQKHEAASAKALPALTVVGNLQDRANRQRELANSLGADAIYALDRRVANGKFAVKPAGWSDERLAMAETSLAEAGLLDRTEQGWLLPLYGVRFEDIDEGLHTEDACERCWCTGSSCYCGTEAAS